MMDDPLKRRMFAQPVRANQPMGILASSPQLMNTVQGYANGGEVKGYKAGGIEDGNIERGKFFFNSTNPGFIDRLLMGQGILGAREGAKKEDIAKKEAGISPIIPGVNQTAVNANPFEINKKQAVYVPEKGKKSGVGGEEQTSKTILKQLKDADKDKGTIDFEDQPTRVFEDVDPTDPKFINEKNKKALDKKKKANTLDPSKSDFEAGKTKPQFKELRDAKDKLAEIQNTINKPDPGAPVVQEFKGVLDQIQTELDAKGEELTAKEVDELARRYAGIEDNANYDEDKHTAFWMALIKGGLATAAGESSNALTNIAKGLSIGVDAYGKDISKINAQERQDRKDLAQARYKVVQDFKNEKTALRATKIQYLQNKAQLLQSSEQFKESMEFKKTEAANENAFRAATFEVNLFKTINDANIAGETLEIRKAELAQNKELREKTINLTIKEIESRENLAVLGEDAKRILAMGDEYATFKDGKFKVTDDGKELLETYLMSKTTGKLTDLMQQVKDAKENLMVSGIKFKDAKTAKSAAFAWYKGGYADAVGKAKDDVITGRSSIDVINDIKKQFAKDYDGVFGAQTPANDGFGSVKVTE